MQQQDEKDATLNNKVIGPPPIQFVEFAAKYIRHLHYCHYHHQHRHHQQQQDTAEDVTVADLVGAADDDDEEEGGRSNFYTY